MPQVIGSSEAGKRSEENGIADLDLVPVSVKRPADYQSASQESSSLAGDVVVRQVHLHAERVDEELEAASLVVEAVDHDADQIVLVRAVAVA